MILLLLFYKWCSINYNSTICTISSPGININQEKIHSLSGILRFETIIFKENVNTIYEYSFTECTNIREVIFEQKVQEIKNYAFYNLPLLEKVSFSGDIQIVDEFAFGKNPLLSTVQFNANISSLNCAFIECPNLATFSFPNLRNSSSLRVSLSDKYDQRHNKIVSNYGLILSKDMKRILFGMRQTEIMIPYSIKTIGKNAFFKHVELESVTFEDNSCLEYIEDYAFYGCHSLQSINFPTSLVSIGEYSLAFININKFIIYQSLSTLQKTTFFMCSNINNITVINDNQNYVVINHMLMDKQQKSIFLFEKTAKKIRIPDTIQHIAPCSLLPLNGEEIEVSNNNSYYEFQDFVAFNVGKTTLIAVSGSIVGNYVIPSSVTNIDKYAFYGSKITNIEFANVENNIVFGQSCFQSSSLTSISFPKGTITIEEYAFANCSSILEIDFAGNVMTISNNAFENCCLLATVSFSKASLITYIKNSAFANCKSLMAISFPQSIAIFEDYSFYNCISLAIIKCPDNLIRIGSHCFENCNSLLKIDLSTSISTISSYAFMRCTSLKAIAFPQSIQTIERAAFYSCSSLDTAYFLDNSIKQISHDCFAKCSFKVFTIPSSLQHIGSGAFAGNRDLVTYIVSDMNEYFNNINNCLYTENQTRLISASHTQKDIYLSKTCQTIDFFAFDGSFSTEVIWIDEECQIKILKNHWFYGAFNISFFTLPPSIQDIKPGFFQQFPNLIRVTFTGVSALAHIPMKCFANLQYLERVEIQEAPFLEDICALSFSGCKSLTQFECTSNVKRIKRAAFSGCISLLYLHLSSNIISIDPESFKNCFCLTTVIYCGIEAPINANNIFTNTSVVNVYVSTTFVGNLFGGVPVIPILDAECKLKYNIV